MRFTQKTRIGAVVALVLANLTAGAAQPERGARGAAMKLVTLAVRHAIDSIDEGGPLIPFVLTQQANGNVTLARYIVGPVTHIDWNASTEAANHAVDRCTGVRCVLAFEHPPEGGESPAIVAVLVIPAERRTFNFIQPFTEGNAIVKARADGPLHPGGVVDWPQRRAKKPG